MATLSFKPLQSSGHLGTNEANGWQGADSWVSNPFNPRGTSERTSNNPPRLFNEVSNPFNPRGTSELSRISMVVQDAVQCSKP